MEIPSSQLMAPSPPMLSLDERCESASVLAVYGSALLDANTSALEGVEYLWLSGAPVSACRIAGSIPTLRRLVVHDWRSPDLIPLRELHHLESLAIAGSSRLKSLVGIEGLRHLKELILCDCIGFTSIDSVRHLTGLETLCVEGGFNTSLRLDTLEPLHGLVALERLRLASMSVADGSLAPLRSLVGLRSIFVTAQFRAPELRALANALPLARGEFLDSHRNVL
jgi:hypothetical protein